jgi:hypothetical protein
MGLPSTVPPNSCTAISAATTEPLPVMSAVTPDMSVTPDLHKVLANLCGGRRREYSCAEDAAAND